MKPKRIILVRHGESEGNKDEGIYATKPDYQLNLTKSGITQADNCGKDLRKITKEESCWFYVSPLYRTRQTFKEIEKSFLDINYKKREDPRLREQEWGHLKSLDECKRINVERDNYGVFYYRIPDGESAADVFDRVSDFCGALHRDFEKEEYPENCILVTHGMTIRLFIMKWLHLLVEDFEELKNPINCAIIVLELQENGKYALTTPLEKKVP